MVNIKHVRVLPGSSFFWSMAAILGNSVCRAHAPASHAACHDDHENSNAWFSNFLCSYETYGAPLCGPSGRSEAPLKMNHNMYISRVLIASTKVLEGSVKKCKLDFLPRWQHELNLESTGCQ